MALGLGVRFLLGAVTAVDPLWLAKRSNSLALNRNLSTLESSDVDTDTEVLL